MIIDSPLPSRRRLINPFIVLFALGSFTQAQITSPPPMATDYSRSVLPRWLAKPVAESKLLDNCESLSTWTTLIEDQGDPKIALTSERAMDGRQSLRLQSKTVGPKPIPHGRYYGTSSAVRVVKGEDWTGWNRLSFWVQPDLKGFRNVSLIVILHNDGKVKLPDTYGKIGKNYVLLKNHEWNHVVWEIPNVDRDKVTGVEFAYRVQGNEPGAADTVQFDIDKLELQKVQADHFEGWNVAPGAISFSHAGYQTGSPKSALASDLDAKEFQLLDALTKQPVLTKPVTETSTTLGRFQVLDFSEFTTPGSYILRSGTRETQPFRVGMDVWESSLWKAINFFYAERCGFALTGVHDTCHGDWTLKHKGKLIIANGGWHDAGDLSQNLGNTSDCDYSMFTLAERLQARNENPALLAKLVDEAKWGLDFVLKTSFHDGYRTGFNTMDRWTDGIIGTPDDMEAEASKNVSVNLGCAATEAIAARVLKPSDPILAARALEQAEEDWKFAVEMLDHPEPPSDWEKSPMARFWMSGKCEIASRAVIAGIELWKSTGKQIYADKAASYAMVVLDSQETSILPGLNYPITGYFYMTPEKKDVMRYVHMSHEEAPMAALVKLCESLPDHADWMKWYSAVALYSKYYQQAMTEFTQPYGMLANSLYRDDEYKQIPPGIPDVPQESYRDQVTNGVKVGDHFYVRRFPVWFEFRGNHGTALSQAAGLSEAAHLRGDFSLSSLLQQELQWVIGKNPFVQSTMWGEGYDYAPQYTAMSGDLVGSLPVGIQTHRDEDIPYWPAENCHNWKEVWVSPTGKWLWLLKNTSGSALVKGAASGAVVLRNTKLDIRITAQAKEGTFLARVPEGEYEISSGAETRNRVLLSGGTYSVDLLPGKGLDMKVAQVTDADGSVTIQANVTGTGDHSIELRSDHLELGFAVQKVILSGSSKVITFKAKVNNLSAPWVAIVVPDGELSARKEVTGLAWRK